MRTTSKRVRGADILARDGVPGDRSFAEKGQPFVWTARRRQPIRLKRIGLFGLFGAGNSGNDGSLETMLAFLRQARPDAEITCICAAHRGADAEIAGTLHVAAIPFGIPPFDHRVLRAIDQPLQGLPRRFASVIRAIRQTCRLDALIVPGTGILDDFCEGPLNMPLTLFAWCLAARLSGARIAFVSIGAGPIHHPTSRWLMRSAAAMAEYRSYRDTISKDYMTSIGFDARSDPVYPDLAFKLPTPRSARRSADQVGPVSVGVGVMAYHGWRKHSTDGPAIYAAYLEKITRFVLWLLDRGHTVRILTGDRADVPAVTDLMARMAAVRPGLPAARLRAEPTCSLHDLMRQIAETDVVVATRFHNIVCALKLGKPTVSISYADKNDVLMAGMGVGRFCQHIEQLSLDLLVEQFTQLIADRQRYARRIEEMNAAYRERLDHQDFFLASHFLGTTPAMQINPRERHG